MELALLGMFGVASLVMFLLTISTFIQTLTLGDSPMSEENVTVELDGKDAAVTRAKTLLDEVGEQGFIMAVDTGETVEAVVSCGAELLVNLAIANLTRILQGQDREGQIHILSKFLQSLGLDSGILGPATIIAFGDHGKSIAAMQEIIAKHTGNNGSVEA